ncbi:MAG: hypothetical protein U7127_11960 [Phormidium sp.]
MNCDQLASDGKAVGIDLGINAAKNIRDEGLRMLEVGHTSLASGERVRPSKGTDESEASFCEGRISPKQRRGNS